MNRHADPSNHHVASMTGGPLPAIMATGCIDKSRQTVDYLGTFVDGAYCLDAPQEIPSGSSSAGLYYLTVDASPINRNWL